MVGIIKEAASKYEAALHIGKYLFGKGRSNRYSRNLMMQIRMTAMATAMPMTPAAG